MTIELESITGQQAFDSYIAEFAGLALHLINELVVTRIRGRSTPPPPTGEPLRKLVNATITAYDTTHDRPRWTALTAADATALVVAVRRLHQAVDACIDADLDAAVPILNALLQTHHAAPNLHGHHGRPPVLTFHHADATANDGRIADMTTSLAMIIGTGRSTRLGRCAATGCDRVFYDATRNASQRYCELSCQNRAKAAAYRARQRHP